MIAARAVVCHFEICEICCIFHRRAGEQSRQPFSGGWCLPNLCDILPPQIQLIGTPVCVEIDAIQVCGLGEQLLSNPCDTLHPEYRCQHCLFFERFAVSGWLLQVQQQPDTVRD